MISSAIFDIDGTLLDSTPIWDNLGARLLQSLGVTPRAGLHEVLRVMALNEGAAYLRREYSLPVSESELLRMTDEMIRGFYTNEVQAKHGAKELLEALYSRGVKLAIATAGNAEISCKALERLGLMEYFSDVFSCTRYGGKNSPAVYLAAAERLGSLPQNIIVYEDSLHALKTARDAGFLTAAVCDNSEPNQTALKSLAHFYAPDLMGHITFLDELLK